MFTLKVDTILGQRTDIEVTLTANDGVRETAKQADCRDLNQEELEALASIIGKVLPIPGLPGIGR
nr:MAG: hypothetical protein DIU80_01730 [Chloroflexota bacterium]